MTAILAVNYKNEDGCIETMMAADRMINCNDKTKKYNEKIHTLYLKENKYLLFALSGTSMVSRIGDQYVINFRNFIYSRLLQFHRIDINKLYKIEKSSGYSCPLEKFLNIELLQILKKSIELSDLYIKYNINGLDLKKKSNFTAIFSMSGGQVVTYESRTELFKNHNKKINGIGYADLVRGDKELKNSLETMKFAEFKIKNLCKKYPKYCGFESSEGVSISSTTNLSNFASCMPHDIGMSYKLK